MGIHEDKEKEQLKEQSSELSSVKVSGQKKLRSPFSWFGGKGLLVSRLLEYAPRHRVYLEVFGGGANLLFAKEPVELEVYNDIDESLVNFFRVLRDEEKFEKFYRKVCLTPYARAEFDYCKETWDTVEDEVERAYRWYVVAKMSFSGVFGSGWHFAVNTIRRNMPLAVSSWLSTIELLPEIHQRVMRVQIENKDWFDFLETYSGYDFDEEFVYLDPPYLPETRRNGEYRYEMSREDHEKLIDYLLTHKRRVMLSGYDNELYQKLEKHGWKKICWEIACRAVGRTRGTGILGDGATLYKNQRRLECIWINYDPSASKFNSNTLFDWEDETE